MHSMECQALCQTLAGGGDRDRQGTLDSHSRGACWHLRAHHLRVQERRQRGGPQQVQAAMPVIALSSSQRGL